MEISKETIKELPILKYREEIISKINQNTLTMISAATGSGKTTQVPQFILNDAKERGVHCNILVSQPRKIAAITLALRVAKERECEIGSEVGYQVGLYQKKDNDTSLLFCTTGVILQKLIEGKNMDFYTHIILDEVHERDVDMDLLLTIVCQFLEFSENTKIILMSATSDDDSLLQYFGRIFQGSLTPAIISHKAERNFSIEKLYLDDLKFPHTFVDNISSETSSNLYDIAKKVVQHQMDVSTNSILVFLPGINEIKAFYTILREDSVIMNSYLVCSLHSRLPQDEQQIAFKSSSKPKLVLCTNIAESSITITSPQVDCVIDFCLTKYLVTSKESSMAQLKLDWAAKNNLEQRAGRTGRTCDGTVYRLVTKEFYNNMLKYAIPEMTRCPLETVIIRVKTLNEAPVELLAKAPSPPEVAAILRSVMILKELGGLERVFEDDQRNIKFYPLDGNLTYVGRIMAALPLDVHITKFIIVGYMYSVLEEAIIIGAGLSVQSIFRNNFARPFDDYAQKLSWAAGSGCDFIAILNAYKQWQHMKEQGKLEELHNWNEQNWCMQHNLNYKNLKEMSILIGEITQRLEALQMIAMTSEYSVTWEEKEKTMILKICIAGAFLPNFFIAGECLEAKEIDIVKEIGGKNPLNSVYFKNMQKDIIGEVYEAQFKQRLVDSKMCSRIDDVTKVTFDKGSTKVFVEFNNRSSMVDNSEISRGVNMRTGKVAPEVYKAVKLRMTGYKLVLNVMQSNETNNYALTNGLVNENYELNELFINHPDACVTPITCEASVRGCITHIDHCGKFYVQPMTEKNISILKEIHQELAERGLKISPTFESLNINQNVVAFDGDLLKRAKVIGKDARHQRATVYLIDFGQTIEIPINAIFMKTSWSLGWPKAPTRIFEYPERCFEAKLCEIQPSMLKCPRGIWTTAAVKWFRQQAWLKECNVEVFSVVNDVASVKLWIDDICINDGLINAGFAQECEETYQSKLDHEVRKQNQAFSVQFDAKEEFARKIDKFADTLMFMPPPIPMCQRKITLVGPFSPMVTSVCHVLLHSDITKVSIDPQSVNSVVLHDDPSNIYGRLMIAANVSKKPNGMILHETSTMPDIPGLPVLLAMVFAPDVIFRHNQDMTKLDNMQFGLGSDPQNFSPYFRNHDCILPVNFELDQEDFNTVNNLRFNMSYLLMLQLNEQISSLGISQKADLLAGVKREIIKLLSKKRDPLATSYVTEEYRNWYKDDTRFVFVEEKFYGGGLYHQLPRPKLLKPSSETIQKLKEKLNDMISDFKISYLTTSDSNSSFNCPLCDRDFDGKVQLQVHFVSKMHKNRYKKLMDFEETPIDEEPENNVS